MAQEKLLEELIKEVKNLKEKIIKPKSVAQYLESQKSQ